MNISRIHQGVGVKGPPESRWRLLPEIHSIDRGVCDLLGFRMNCRYFSHENSLGDFSSRESSSG